MPQALRCPGCGSALPADAPEGLCPGCLLEQAMRGGSGSGEDPGTTTTRSPGPAFVPPSPEDLAPFFPQLEVIERLGHGGMGVVYKARQVRLDRLEALKILPPELGRDPAFAERFAREARALARLSHPRIVGVHDFGESGGLFYLLMEFVDGVNLRGLLRRGRMTPEEALRIVPQVCEALQYAHEEGVIHRDIKPENILDRRGNVKIADFGLAKLLGAMTPDSALTGSRQVIGTLRYMAPEQMERPLAVDHRADIYSLGVVFYEMLTGELPMGRFAPPSKKVDVDVRLDEVVLRALEKEPEGRYQHASEVKTEVESLSVPPGPPAVPSRPPSQEEDRGRPIAAAAGGRPPWPLLAVIVGFYVFSVFLPTWRPWPNSGAETGARFVFAEMDRSAFWMANPVLWLGCGLLMTRRWLAAGLAGLVAILLALSLIFAVDRQAGMDWIHQAGYRMWLASMVLLASGGFYGWWKSGRGRRAGVVETIPPEIDPPKPDSARDFGDLGTRPGLRVAKDGGLPAFERREAWLLIPLISGIFIVAVVATVPPDARLSGAGVFAIVLAAGAGLWGSWRFVRGDRAGDINSPGETRNHPDRERRRARRLVVLLGVVSLVAVGGICWLISMGMIGTALAVGFGLGVSWLRAWELVHPDRAKGRPEGAAENRHARPLLVVIGTLYGFSFFSPVYYAYGEWSLHVEGVKKWPDPEIISLAQPRPLKGYEVFGATFRQGSPMWLANPALGLGCLALMKRRWRWAALAGLIAMCLSDPSSLTGNPSADYLVEHGEFVRLQSPRASEIVIRRQPADAFHFLAGDLMWKASMVLLAGGGLYGWWRSRGQSPAADIKTTVPEIDPPRSSLDRDFDGS